MKPTNQRDSIFLEDAVVLEQHRYEADQYILRIRSPQCAKAAQPGSFAHIQCNPMLPLRRPLSIMRTDPNEGWVEFLYKIAGYGTRLLSEQKPGETISVLGPIGRPFVPTLKQRRPLLIGGGVGIPPMIFLSDYLRRQSAYQPLVLLGSEVPFPFRPRPSQFVIPGMQDGIIAAMPLLEDWGIASRLASLQGYPGHHEGYVTTLARQWLQTLTNDAMTEVEIFACGPHPMLAAVAELANEFSIPAQISMEEYMACGVGGCAGCTIRLNTSTGPAMKRVCVDGPVFNAKEVDFSN